jgi:hypothetical protein
VEGWSGEGARVESRVEKAGKQRESEGGSHFTHRRQWTEAAGNGLRRMVTSAQASEFRWAGSAGAAT